MSHRMMVWFMIVALSSGIGLTLPSAASADQKSNAQEKKDDARVKQQAEEAQRVQKQLQEEQKDLTDAEKELAQAQAKLKASGRDEEATRDRVEAAQGRTIGIDRALQTQAEAKKSYDAAANPILTTLKESPAYKAAKAQAEKGHEELKRIAAMKELSGDERRRLEAAANLKALAVANLEQETLLSHPEVVALKEKQDAAAKHVQELRGRIKTAVDKDSTVKAAHESTNKARDGVEAAQRHVVQLRSKVAATRAKLAKEANDVAKAKAADKANDNKKPNNKGKK